MITECHKSKSYDPLGAHFTLEVTNKRVKLGKVPKDFSAPEMPKSDEEGSGDEPLSEGSGKKAGSSNICLGAQYWCFQFSIFPMTNF